jgi:ketosteroid isomerase-like protein
MTGRAGFATLRLAMDGTGDTGARISVVRRAFDHFEAGDLDTMFDLVHPEAEFHPVFYPGSYRGRDAIRAIFEGDGARRRWTVSGLELDEVAGKVIAHGRLHSTNTFGTAQEFPVAWIIEVAEGVIVRMRGYVHRRQALEALGAAD